MMVIMGIVAQYQANGQTEEKKLGGGVPGFDLVSQLSLLSG
jgi:hypothetical protein